MSRFGPKPRPIWDRFWEKVDASGDCWEWTASRIAGVPEIWTAVSDE